jgi:tetratricopeptide (TPR) repeat protein
MKLNIGCGKKYDPDYCNVDLYEDLVADRLMSAYNLEFDENSCEEIKAIHIIEHLSFFETIYALSEFFRVLEPNGKLIIETPDLEKSCQHYLKADREQKKEILGWLFGIPHKGLQHKLCFPSFLLIDQLENTGFENITTSSFYNHEAIPSVRFNCYKRGNGDDFKVFQIISKLRKDLFLTNQIDFTDSFLTKEQEDLVIFIASKLLESRQTKKKELIKELFVELLFKWPEIVKSLLLVIENENYISPGDFLNIKEISELLIEHRIVNVLFNSITEGPTNPGTQRIVFFSVESFARKLIENILNSKENREELIGKIKTLNKTSKDLSNKIFSAALIERTALNLFYLGIKSFHQKNYTHAHNLFLSAIKLNRDNYIFFWNLSKTLARLESYNQSEKVYKKTLRLIKITKVKNKQDLKSQIQQEFDWIKKRKGDKPKFDPIII